MGLDCGKHVLVVFHIPYLDQTIGGTRRNVVGVGREHYGIDRDWFYRVLVELSVKNLIVRLLSIDKDDPAVLSRTTNYLV